MSDEDNQSNSSVFDRQSVLDMVDGEVDFVCELIEMFLADVNPQLQDIQSAITSNNAGIVQKTCHRLKTSVGNLGGTQARPLIVELEHLARAGSLVGAKELFAQCVLALHQFETALRQFQAESASLA